ncbi:MAG: protoporphyrinogen oxidase [Planctomycetes bacterium]|nr:protoporphyrinogen oxidase [Planctomycetota bacterium]
MTRARRDVIVVGGGISGLVVAWRLRRAGVDVSLLEAGGEVGGCMQSEPRDGLILEKGPFNVLVRDEAFQDLLDACAADVTPVAASEESRARYIMRGGRLHQVPSGPMALLRTPLLSFGAKLRLLRGMIRSRPRSGAETTIAEAASRRLGPEVAETFVSSIIAGVYGGDSAELSLDACLPTIAKLDREARSPLGWAVKRARARRREGTTAKRRIKGMISFEGGLRSLAQWLGDQLGANLVTGCPVESVERDDDGYTLKSGDRVERCRHLVLATPKETTSRLLRPLAPRASEELDGIEAASLVVLNLAFRRDDVAHPMEGYGFLVPRNEPDMPVMGVLWADSVFPHHAPSGDRLLRVFMGGPRDPEAARRDDQDLLATARGAIDGLLGITGAPTHVDICRWPEAIPQYRIGHTALLERLDETTRPLPMLHLVGNYLHGVSINDCVRDAALAAETIVGACTNAPRHGVAVNGGGAVHLASAGGREPRTTSPAGGVHA